MATIVKLRAAITVETRPPKHIHSLAELTADWRARASRALGRDATQWARPIPRGRRPGSGVGDDRAAGRARDRADPARGLLRADDISLDAVAEVARATVGAVSQKRSTWKHWNLWGEASWQTIQWRFAATAHREAAVRGIVEEAERLSIALTPPSWRPAGASSGAATAPAGAGHAIFADEAVRTAEMHVEVTRAIDPVASVPSREEPVAVALGQFVMPTEAATSSPL